MEPEVNAIKSSISSKYIMISRSVSQELSGTGKDY